MSALLFQFGVNLLISLSSFHSAASSIDDSMVTADEGTVIYLEGLRPSLTDCQVTTLFKFLFLRC
jgi:hypothetical protein